MFIDASDRYRLGDFQLGKMVFFIPAEFALGVEKDGVRRSARTASGKVVDLAQLKGEAVFRIDDIRVEQLGWLAKNRQLEYLVVKQKEGLVAVCVA